MSGLATQRLPYLGGATGDVGFAGQKNMIPELRNLNATLSSLGPAKQNQHQEHAPVQK